MMLVLAIRESLYYNLKYRLHSMCLGFNFFFSFNYRQGDPNDKEGNETSDSDEHSQIDNVLNSNLVRFLSLHALCMGSLLIWLKS